MKYQTKSLGFLAAAGLLSLNFVAGCKDTGTGTNGTKVDTTVSDKSYSLRKWGKVDQAFVGNAHKTSKAQVSGDQNWIYLIAEGGDAGQRAYAVSVSDFAAGITSQDKWSNIEVGKDRTADGFDDKTPGMADLKGASLIDHITTAKLGAFVTVGGVEDANKQHGFYYLEGKDVKYAYNHSATSTFDRRGRHLSTGLGFILEEGQYVFAYEAVNGDNAFVYAVTLGQSNDIAVGKLGETLNYKVQKTGSVPGLSAKFDQPHLVQSADNKNVYIVDTTGVSFVPAAEVGKAVSVAANVAEANAANWRIDSSTPNDRILDLALVGNNLYIALQKDEKKAGATGGVAVYHIGETVSTTAPAAAWADVGSILNITADGEGKVWAVTATGLVEAKEDGTKGEALAQTKAPAEKTAKATYDEGETMPTSDITSARFVGDNLVITTGANKGIFYRLKGVATKL